MKKNFLITMLLLTITATAQVGVQTNDPKATMDIKAQEGKVADGVLVPRLTADKVKEMTEANTPKKIDTDQNSLLVYVTAPFTTTPTTNKEKYELITSKGFYYYDAYDNSGNGKWKKLYDSNTTLSSGGGGKVYLPGPGITFTGADTNKITASGLERVTATITTALGETRTNTGWRYIGMNKTKYGPTGNWATDLQYIPSSSDEGNVAYSEWGLDKSYTQLKNDITNKYGNGTRTAFDFGKVGATGNYSFAGGVYNIVEGNIGAATFGYGNRITGSASLVAGGFNDVQGDMSLVVGENNTLKSTEGFAIIGKDNTLGGGQSFVVGENNQIEASKVIALGTNNEGTSGSASSILIGEQCKAINTAPKSIVIGSLSTSRQEGSILIGDNNQSNHTNGIAIGQENRIFNHSNAILIGKKLKSSRHDQFVCGTGNTEDTDAAFILGAGNVGNLLVVKNVSGQVGDLHAKGKVFSRGSQISSDIRLKKDIENLPVNSDVLSQLRPVQYHWKEGGKNTLQYGFIAQEIEKIFPNLVDTDTQGEKYKSVNYVGLIPVLTKVLQEKSAEIASQKEEIASLKAQLQAEKERNDAQEARLKAIEEKLK